MAGSIRLGSQLVFKGQVHFINKDNDNVDWVRLESAAVLGFDTETKPTFTKGSICIFFLLRFAFGGTTQSSPFQCGPSQLSSASRKAPNPIPVCRCFVTREFLFVLQQENYEIAEGANPKDLRSV